MREKRQQGRLTSLRCLIPSFLHPCIKKVLPLRTTRLVHPPLFIHLRQCLFVGGRSSTSSHLLFAPSSFPPDRQHQYRRSEPSQPPSALQTPEHLFNSTDCQMLQIRRGDSRWIAGLGILPDLRWFPCQENKRNRLDLGSEQQRPSGLHYSAAS